MPEYFFAIRRSGQEHLDERATALNDIAAALDYACHLVRELRASGGYDDPGLLMTVKSSSRLSCSTTVALGSVMFAIDTGRERP